MEAIQTVGEGAIAHVASNLGNSLGDATLTESRRGRDIFNNMINSHSQQVIVTTPAKPKNQSEHLERSNSLNSHTVRNMNSMTKATTKDQEKHSEAGGPNGITQNRQQTFSLDDLKGEPVVFTRSRNRWYTNDEVASILTNFSAHPEWQTNELQMRPKSGAVLLYSREKVRYRQDGYCWKKRKNGRTTREDHMKLKVQGIECIYGCYVHSAILPTFHRRCYWLLENPDIVLVHYLNQPPDDQNKMMITFNSSLLEADTRRTWTNEEIIEEIGSVFGGISQIQQTLNLSFPPSDPSLVNQNQSSGLSLTREQTNKELDRMIESSPQSQATTNSESNSEQVEMAIVDPTPQLSIGCNMQNNESVKDHIDHPQQTQDVTNQQEVLVKREPMAFSQEVDRPMINACSNLLKHLEPNHSRLCSNNNTTNSNCNNHADRSESEIQCVRADNHEQTDRLQDRSMSMTLDIATDGQENMNVSKNCYGYSQSANQLSAILVNRTSTDTSNDSNNNNVDMLDRSKSSQQYGLNISLASQTKPLIDDNDQIPCSPVTQIFNKIVDDIETYALPLETDHQFVTNHHMHHHHHHGITISAMPVQSMDISESERGPSQHGSDLSNQCINHNGDTSTVNIDKDLSGCSMDLTCDLFAADQSSGCDSTMSSKHRAHSQGDDHDNLLITDFNSPAENVTQGEPLGSNVVDSMNNVDDLRDLMMGIPNGENEDHTNLLVDSGSMDLFNFKTSDSDLKPHHEQRHIQLDVKSSLSDTDTLSRLSPLVTPQVPRCNSTGNAVQSFSTSNILEHLSTSDFLGSNALVQELHLEGPPNHQDFREPFMSNHQAQHRSCSSATNPTNSTSCSPSSLNSYRAGFINRTDRIDPYANLQSPTHALGSQPFITMPFQQRQSSEHHETNGSILNSLLPKALSIDGSDLAVNHRISSLACRPRCERKYSEFESLRQNVDTGRIRSMNLGIRLASLSPNVADADVSCLNHGSKLHQTESLSSNSQQHQHLEQTLQASNDNLECGSSLIPILDYVPNWSSVTGGAKILIIGDWSTLLRNTHNWPTDSNDKQDLPFYAIFDDLLVPATLIQDNVLRCYAPSHNPGFIALKVIFMNRVISEQVLFEIRTMCNLNMCSTTSNTQQTKQS